MPSLTALSRTLLLIVPCLLLLPGSDATAADQAATARQAYFHKYFAGSIDGKYPFTMDLKNVGGTLSGSYRYKGKSSDIYLKGRIEPSGAVSMEETDSSKVSGYFTGVLNGTILKGSWQKTRDGKALPFQAEQTSEIVVGTKKQILSRAIGEYRLEGLLGAGGANTLWDTWKHKGRWTSNVSSNSGGTGNGSKVTLTQADLRRLDGMTVRVDPDLRTQLVVDGKPVLAIPYSEGMQVRIGKRYESVTADYLKPFSSATTVIDEDLYLLVQDGVDFSTSMAGSYEAIFGDIVTVSYSIVKDAFTVEFRNGECCDETNFTFSRRR